MRTREAGRQAGRGKLRSRKTSDTQCGEAVQARSCRKENPAHPGRMLTIRQVAEVLGISTPTAWRRIDSGQIRAFRDGRIVRVDRDDLEVYITGRKAGGDPVAVNSTSRLALVPVRGSAEDDEQRGLELAGKFGLVAKSGGR